MSRPKAKRQFNSAIPLTEPSGRTIYLRWRILLTIFLLILLILLTIFAASTQGVEAASLQKPAAQTLTSPKVVAFYYTWFDENSWNATLSDQPPQGYVSRDRAVMGRHIDQAKQAGIDAFVVAWYGPTGQFNQTEPNLIALLEEAAARNFQIGILFETNSPFFAGIGDVTTALRHAHANHVHHPAYLRTAQGKPVIFFWRSQAYSVDAWRGVRNQVDPGYSSVWIGEGIDTSYLAVFDGHHLYSNTWNPPSDLNYTNQKFARWVSEASTQFGSPKAWVATVMPGYNDVGIRPGVGFAQSREGGAYFDRSWQAAIASQPGWIVINSFNEWPEGSYIEPSVTYGDQFLQQSAQWSQQFKQGGSVAPLPAAQQSVPSAPQPLAAPVDIPEFDVGEPATVNVGLLNLRSGPNTGSQILTQLPQGSALVVIEQQSEWIRVESGEREGWVFASMVRPATGELDAEAVASAATANPVARSAIVRSAEERTAEPTNEVARVGKLPRFIPSAKQSDESGSSGVQPSQPYQQGQTVSVSVALLNLRDGPATSTTILAELPYGAKLVVEDPSVENPDWMQVRYDKINDANEALLGWVYLSMVE